MQRKFNALDRMNCDESLEEASVEKISRIIFSCTNRSLKYPENKNLLRILKDISRADDD